MSISSRPVALSSRLVAAATAMFACMAFILVGLPHPAMAADATSTITLQSGSGASLTGHTFNIYKLATYDNVVEAGGKVTSYGATAVDTATDTWIKSGLTAAGVALNDDSGINALLRLNSTGSAAKLAKIAATLAGSTTGKTPAVANVAGSGTSQAVTVPTEGYYLVVDSQGLPVLVGTKINGEDLANQAGLGTVVIKSTVSTLSKTVKSGDGTFKSSVASTAGSTQNFKIDFTMPSALAAATANAVTIKDKTSTHIAADGNNFKAVILAGANKGDDVTSQFTLTADADGHGFTAVSTPALVNKYGNQQVEFTYTGVLDGMNHAAKDTSTATMTVAFKPETGAANVTGTSTTTVTTDSFGINKISAADGKNIAGAGFKIQNTATGAWLTQAEDGTWSNATSQATATEFKTAIGTDSAYTPAFFDGLGYGTYLVQESTTPTGFIKSATEFTVKIQDANTVSVTHNSTLWGSMVTDITNASGVDGKASVTVKNMNSITQLPQTGVGVPATLGLLLASITALALVVLLLVRVRSAMKRNR